MRIGCFLSGCCWGKASSSFCAVSFPPNTGAGMYQMANNIKALFPSQLLASLNGLIIVIIILSTEKIIKSNNFSLYLFITLYAISRFIVDFTRHYRDGEMICNLSFNQWFCILFFVIGIGLIFIQIKISRVKMKFTNSS